MKQAISGSWVYATVLIFMVILIAYVSITINYSNAFEASENVIKAIEEYEGYNPKSRKQIEFYFSNNIHTVKHACSDQLTGYTGTVGGSGVGYEKKPTGKYDYCIARTSHTGNDNVTRCYYHTYVFFSFSLPVLGDLFAFKIPGETTGIRNAADDVWGTCK